MNCFHKVKGIRLCAGDKGVRFFHTFKWVREKIEIHSHLHIHIQADRPDTCTCTLMQRHTDRHTQLETPAHSHWHPLYLLLSGGLLKPLLKSKQFHCSLWPTVFIFRALCSYSNCASCPVESDRDNNGETLGPLQRREEMTNLGFINNFYSTFFTLLSQMCH